MPNTKGQPQTQYILLVATKKGKKNLFGDRNRASGGNAPSCAILSSSCCSSTGQVTHCLQHNPGLISQLRLKSRLPQLGVFV